MLYIFVVGDCFWEGYVQLLHLYMISASESVCYVLCCNYAVQCCCDPMVLLLLIRNNNDFLE